MPSPARLGTGPQPDGERDWSRPPFRPQARQAEALACEADICFMGGALGGGKSVFLCMEAMRWMGTENFSAVMFRKTYPELTMSGGLWPRLSGMMRFWPGAVANESEHTWTVPGGGKVKCSHLQHAKNRHDHQGGEYTLICFDELCGGEDSPGFTEEEFWFLMTRNRNPTCRVRPYVRASMNPNPDSWVRDFIDWWIDDDGYAIPERSGVVRWFVRNPGGDGYLWGDTEAEVQAQAPGIKPLSFTFILSTLADNRALLDRDPDYGSKVAGSLHRVERLRLLGDGERGGNWDIRATAGDFFQRAWFSIQDQPPTERCVRVRGWDLAATKPSERNRDPDWTRGVRLARNDQAHTTVEDVVSLRGTPGQVEALLELTTLQDGPGVTQVLVCEPGSGGIGWIESLALIVREAGGLAVVLQVPRSKKEEYAKPVSSAAEPEEGHVFGKVSVVAGEWTAAFLNELEAFPIGSHDDQVDALAAAWSQLPRAGAGPLEFWTPGRMDRVREAGKAPELRSSRERKRAKRRKKWDGM
jgi:phage terminase large subunit-like protein